MPLKIVQPQVEIVSVTPDALELLIYTKSTRLQGRQTLEAIKTWPMEKKLEELAYMRDTIKSSWEFVDYTFEIHGVSRSFTHQFVRTRDQAGIDDPAFGSPDANPVVAAFAQESQRTVDARDNGFVLPEFKVPENEGFFLMKLEAANDDYATAIDKGEPPQNARFLMPHAVSTSIIAKFSLRSLHHMAEVRLCTRTQGEYQNVFRLMRDAVYAIHPWAKMWIEVYCVNHGVCCFPRYSKCPIQGPVFNPDTGLRHDGEESSTERPATRKEILKLWEDNRHEATPVAVAGKTM